VENGNLQFLRRHGDQQAGDLTASLASLREQALYLKSTVQMRCGRGWLRRAALRRGQPVKVA
jgi:hypothetical protein